MVDTNILKKEIIVNLTVKQILEREVYFSNVELDKFAKQDLVLLVSALQLEVKELKYAEKTRGNH